MNDFSRCRTKLARDEITRLLLGWADVVLTSMNAIMRSKDVRGNDVVVVGASCVNLRVTLWGVVCHFSVKQTFLHQLSIKTVHSLHRP